MLYQLLSRMVAKKALLLLYIQLVKHLRYIRPKKAARVFIKKNIGRMQFLNILNTRNIDYVLLRWWEDLPKMPPGEDMDILIKDEHRDLISDLVTFRDNGSDLKCDIYTLSGSKFGSHNDLPYFQVNLARTLLTTRVLYKGAYVPSPTLYLASLAYHAVFHKGATSGIPGFNKTGRNIEHNYTSILKSLADELGLDVEISVMGIYKWLRENNFAPADDTLTKLVEIRPELNILEKSLYSDVRGGDLIVYVVRERLIDDGLLTVFESFLKEAYKFEILDVYLLNSIEQDLCSTYIRGGKWDNGPYKYSGGLPSAFVIAFDYHPWPLSASDQLKQPRMTNNNNLKAKYIFRDKVKALTSKGNYNALHSSDNELDAWFYISLLGENYRLKILQEVEYRRTSFVHN